MEKSSINHSLLPDEFSTYEQYANTLCSFLSSYKFLYFYETNKHTVQFFINKDYERIPSDWRSALEKLDERQLLEMVYHGKIFSHFPSNLQSFVKTCHSLYLKGTISKEKKVTSSLDGEITRGMNEKKKYECEKLAELISQIAKQNQCTSIVDIGSGKGYLSQLLAHKYELSVIGIDNNKIVTHQAQKRKEIIEKHLKKETKFQAITSHLSSDLDVSQFLKILNPLQNKQERMALIGLHTCGDLASTTLKLFVNSFFCKSVVNVGCCYHFMNESLDNETKCGFPLSSIVKKHKILLTSTGKSLGVTTLEHWRPSEENLPFAFHHLRRHAHRCAIELLLHQKNQLNDNNADRGCYKIPRVSVKDSTTFSKFAKTALQKMVEKKPSKGKQISSEFINWVKSNEFTEEWLTKWYQQLKPLKDDQIQCINVFWCVKTLLGPLIEALILMDRILFLKEQDCVETVKLIRLFDSSISPRGLVIVANKKEDSEN